ncbi:MAG: hypothetical protein PHP06_09130 [Clostridia bacterium]|jgi:hypothetical protein|nr:hypothetical protein [Clostridia bacterium]
MSVETLHMLSTISFIIAAIMLVLSAVFFIVYKIPRVIGDITGVEAKKNIERIRKQNEETGKKVYKPSPVNIARGKITDKLTISGQLVSKADNIVTYEGLPQIFTEQLNDSGETTVLDQDFKVANETTVLYPDPEQEAGSMFSIEFEISHTDSTEIIE